MAPFVVTSAMTSSCCSASTTGLRYSAPMSMPANDDVLLRALRVVRDVRGGGGVGAAENYDSYLAGSDAGNSSVSDEDPNEIKDDSPPIVSTPTSTSDDANSIIQSFEEELVRIRFQIEAEAEQEWEMWRKQMLERRRMRKRLQNEEQMEQKEEEQQEEIEAAKEEHGVRARAEPDASTDSNEDEYESTAPLPVEGSEETASESEIVLLDEEEEEEKEEEEEEEEKEKEKEQEEDSSTSSSSQDTDMVDEVAPLEDEGGKDGYVEDKVQAQGDIEPKEEEDSGYDEQTKMDYDSEESFGMHGDIDDNTPIKSQEDIGFIGDYDAPTDSDNEPSCHEEEENFQYEYMYEQKDISVDGDGCDTATINMNAESNDLDDLNGPVEGHFDESDDSAYKIPEKRRKKKKKRKKRKQSRHETTIEEISGVTETELPQADVALSGGEETNGVLLSPSFARKIVFYVGFAAFLSLFKLILDALARMGLQ